MTAYIVVTQTISDLETYMSDYVSQVIPFIVKHEGEVIVAASQAQPLEGNPADGVVVLKFPSEEAALAFVNDPGYQPVKKIRHSITTNGNMVLAPEFQAPDSEE